MDWEAERRWWKTAMKAKVNPKSHWIEIYKTLVVAVL